MYAMNILTTLTHISHGYRSIVCDIEDLFDDPSYEEVFLLTEKAALESIRVKLMGMKTEIDRMARSIAKESEVRVQ